MANFNLEDYETVEERLQRYLKDHKDARIVTNVFYQDENRILIRAWVYRNIEEQEKNLPHATGLAEEVRGEGYVNKTSHVENCETSAIGRALANAGYSGNKNGQRASRQEMQKVQRMEEAENKDVDVTDTAICPIHEIPMRHFEKDGNEWWSHRLENGSWCNGKPAKKAVDEDLDDFKAEKVDEYWEAQLKNE